MKINLLQPLTYNVVKALWMSHVNVAPEVQRVSRVRIDWGKVRSSLIYVFRTPERIMAGFMNLPWPRLLTVRRGFLLGAMAGFSVAGSVLWAIPSILPYFPGHVPEINVLPAHDIPVARTGVPVEMAWFFVQYPYLSSATELHAKNRHSYIVKDVARKRHYVVSFGQRYRRVEIYTEEGGGTSQVQVYTPGMKRTVWFQGLRVVSQTSASDGNLWMWNNPLWNATHIKLYGLADLWLDSPFKRFSCAGFVHQFLKDAGIQVPVLDAWDMAKQPWVRIPIEEIEPGDVITIKAASAQHRRFWGHRVTHVGVYVGHGKFIHAATSSHRAKRAWVRIADVEDFKPRIDKILRPPELL